MKRTRTSPQNLSVSSMTSGKFSAVLIHPNGSDARGSSAVESPWNPQNMSVSLMTSGNVSAVPIHPNGSDARSPSAMESPLDVPGCQNNLSEGHPSTPNFSGHAALHTVSQPFVPRGHPIHGSDFGPLSRGDPIQDHGAGLLRVGNF